jgi:hypothetical protein
LNFSRFPQREWSIIPVFCGPQVFNDRLYVSFVGTNADKPVLVCSTADGVNWTNYTAINQYSPWAPSLAVFEY